MSRVLGRLVPSLFLLLFSFLSSEAVANSAYLSPLPLPWAQLGWANFARLEAHEAVLALALQLSFQAIDMTS
jgi:hypothetical protein